MQTLDRHEAELGAVGRVDEAAVGDQGVQVHVQTQVVPKPLHDDDQAGMGGRGQVMPALGEATKGLHDTLSSHLDNVYARLRISGRAALTRWLIESGLAD